MISKDSQKLIKVESRFNQGGDVMEKCCKTCYFALERSSYSYDRYGAYNCPKECCEDQMYHKDTDCCDKYKGKEEKEWKRK